MGGTSVAMSWVPDQNLRCDIIYLIFIKPTHPMARNDVLIWIITSLLWVRKLFNFCLTNINFYKYGRRKQVSLKIHPHLEKKDVFPGMEMAYTEKWSI